MAKKDRIKSPVALIFFNRPEEFKRVFETVRKEKPEVLFLIQDGPRKDNKLDLKNMQRCRDIAESVDWECEVYKNYSSENLGCGRRVYSGITWAFSYVDRLIILEDDCLPSQSFFPFCDELLEKYLYDPRIGMISGMNHMNTFDKISYDYLFARVGSIAGWATWKRSWDTIEYDLDFIKDEDTLRLLNNYISHNRINSGLVKNAIKLKERLMNGENLTSWSYQRVLNDYLNSALIIVPKYNLMSNIGLTEESVHSVNDIRKVPRAMRKLYKLKLYEIKFPLQHPKYIIEDIEYNKLVDKMMSPKGILKYSRRIESITYRLFLGDAGMMFKKLKIKIINKIKR